MQDYFIFWRKEGSDAPKEINLPIVRGEKNAATGELHLIIGGAAKTIRRDGNTLFVGGAPLREAALQLMAALDEKYFYSGILPATGSDGEAMKKAGIAGKTLP